MAALQGQYEIASIALAAGVPKTVIRLKAPANQRAKVLGYGFYFDGTSNSATPVQGQIGRISADGTYGYNTGLNQAAVAVVGGGGAIESNDEDLTETFQTTIGSDASAEPTYSNYLKTFTVHPQLGYEYLAPPGQEIVLKGGGMLGFVITAPAAVDVSGYVMVEE